MKPLHGRCILAVDSDDTRISQWLRAQGARVICSASIDSALATGITFPHGTFDAVVMEHRSQSLNAVALAEAMRALPSMRNVPLLIIAEGREAADLRSRVPAPYVVLVRPVAVEQLIDQLVKMFAPVHAPGTFPLVSSAQESRGAVLMAEDDPANAKMLRAMLCQVGFSVVTALNGEEAVARAATGSFDVIFMDGQMPVMDGLDATRIIRDDEARRGIHRPIIGVTASSMDEYRDQCIDAGMDDVVHKPVTMAGLLRMLARWLPEAPVPPVKPSVPAMTSLPPTSVERTGASTPKEAKVIDWSQLDSLRSVDPHRGNGVVGRAIGLYVDSAPKLIEEIRGFRSGKDIKDVRRAAHFLRSSSMSLGATVVAGLSKAIESAAAQGDLEIIDATVSALEAEYWRAASELRKAVA